MKVGILGVSGYTGQALYECLRSHPKFEIASLYSATQKYKCLSEIHSLWPKMPITDFDPHSQLAGIEILFLAIPHGQSHRFMDVLRASNPKLKIVDLSADFRFDSAEAYPRIYDFEHQSKNSLAEAVYGVPELNKAAIQKASLCANPGCYAIASILALLPLKELLKDPVIIDAKSGVSGAGKSLNENFLFCEVNENFSAYKTGAHRHQPEIAEKVGIQNLFFSPHLIPQQKGILASLYTKAPQGFDTQSLIAHYEDFYTKENFVKISAAEQASTKWVINSNYCILNPKIVGDHLVVFSAIDNLMKGAASVAVQNANLMAGYPETLGLL